MGDLLGSPREKVFLLDFAYILSPIHLGMCRRRLSLEPQRDLSDINLPMISRMSVD